MINYISREERLPEVLHQVSKKEILSILIITLIIIVDNIACNNKLNSCKVLQHVKKYLTLFCEFSILVN